MIVALNNAGRFVARLMILPLFPLVVVIDICFAPKSIRPTSFRQSVREAWKVWREW